MSEEESLPGLESSDSSEEPDDEFMLRLYTGKLKNDQQYHLRKEGTDTAGTDENEANEPEDGAEVVFNRETHHFEVGKKRKLEDLSWWEDDKSSKKPKLTHSVSQPTTPSRYWDNVKCYNCNQTGHLVGACPEESTKRCPLCGLPAHRTKGCPNQLCFRCFSPGHQRNQCSAILTALPDCYRCGGHHDPIRCPSAMRSPNRKSLYCFNCGEEGHAGQECRKPSVDELAEIRDPRQLAALLQFEERPYKKYNRRRSEPGPRRWR